MESVGRHLAATQVAAKPLAVAHACVMRICVMQKRAIGGPKFPQ